MEALKHFHSHDVDETPAEIANHDLKLGHSLTLRTEDSLTEKDAVKGIRKGGLLTLDTGNSLLSLT